ncbi:hypothetical protein EDC01DRAFT_791959 [Geopyxis carbonaria]|nr:hypothetical protein EDC01DRAFT_791959 [Geopyxis carbonaria]
MPPDPAVISALQRLRRLSTNATTTSVSPTPTPESYDIALTTTSRSLRPLIVDEELLLTSLASSSTPSSTPAVTSSSTASAPTRAQIAAHAALANTPGYIPPPTSPLPTLLAYRSLTATIASTLASLPAARARLADADARLHATTAALAEQQALHDSLTARLDAPAPAITTGSTEDLQAQTVRLTRRTRTALKALRAFVGATLTPMLELEEAGGPVAGTVMPDEAKVGDRTQRTLREMWRSQRREEGGEGGVREEMWELLEGLMNEAVVGEGWCEVGRESAAVRYLVRAGVAVMERRDAGRVRLVAFGAGFE